MFVSDWEGQWSCMAYCPLKINKAKNSMLSLPFPNNSLPLYQENSQGY